MKEDIIKRIETSLGGNALPKIDPNTQQPVTDHAVSIDDAAVPAILAGLYKKTRNEEGATELIEKKGNSIFEIIFGDQKENVAKSVADYAGVSEADALTEMQDVADVSREYVVNDLKHNTPTLLMDFFTAQRTHILTHLPAALNVGELLNDSTIDDQTNKMEGPMSGLMHGIEKLFSSSK